MAAAAWLAAGWAVQTEASCPDMPATAPVSAAVSKIRSAAAAIRVIVAGPRSVAGIRHQARLFQLLPAVAGSMSQTDQPPPSGVSVIA